MSCTEIKIADILCDFLIVAVNNILFTRKIYSQTIFERRKKYGVIVYESQHPLLNNYLAEIIKAVHFHLKARQLRQFLLLIVSSGKIIEKYVFDVLHLCEGFESDSLLLKLEENLRAFCIKINTSSVYLNTLPENSEFNINLVTTDYSAKAFNESPEFGDFAWFQVDGNVRTSSPEIVPLHTINTDNLKMQIFIEKCLNE